MNIFKWYFVKHMHITTHIYSVHYGNRSMQTYTYKHLNILAFEWAFADSLFFVVFLFSLFFGHVRIMHICMIFRWLFFKLENFLNGTISHILENQLGLGRVEKRNGVNIRLRLDGRVLMVSNGDGAADASKSEKTPFIPHFCPPLVFLSSSYHLHLLTYPCGMEQRDAKCLAQVHVCKFEMCIWNFHLPYVWLSGLFHYCS